MINVDSNGYNNWLNQFEIEDEGSSGSYEPPKEEDVMAGYVPPKPAFPQFQDEAEFDLSSGLPLETLALMHSPKELPNTEPVLPNTKFPEPVFPENFVDLADWEKAHHPIVAPPVVAAPAVVMTRASWRTAVKVIAFGALLTAGVYFAYPLVQPYLPAKIVGLVNTTGMTLRQYAQPIIAHPHTQQAWTKLSSAGNAVVTVVKPYLPTKMISLETAGAALRHSLQAATAQLSSAGDSVAVAATYGFKAVRGEALKGFAAVMSYPLKNRMRQAAPYILAGGGVLAAAYLYSKTKAFIDEAKGFIHGIFG